MENDKLFFPYGLKHGRERLGLSGVGDKEFAQGIKLLIIDGVGLFLKWVISGGDPPILLGLFSLPVIYALVKKDPTQNISIISHVNYNIEFIRSQKFYPYKYLNEWK